MLNVLSSFFVDFFHGLFIDCLLCWIAPLNESARLYTIVWNDGTDVVVWDNILFFFWSISPFLVVEYLTSCRCCCFQVDFRYLRRLLFVHGHDSYERSAFIAQYSYYKNIALALIQLG